MTTLQDQRLARPATAARAPQLGGTAEQFQAGQQQQQPPRDARYAAGGERGDQQQGSQQEQTFTVSFDDWFKA